MMRDIFVVYVCIEIVIRCCIKICPLTCLYFTLISISIRLDTLVCLIYLTGYTGSSSTSAVIIFTIYKSFG